MHSLDHSRLRSPSQLGPRPTKQLTGRHPRISHKLTTPQQAAEVGDQAFRASQARARQPSAPLYPQLGLAFPLRISHKLTAPSRSPAPRPENYVAPHLNYLDASLPIPLLTLPASNETAQRSCAWRTVVKAHHHPIMATAIAGLPSRSTNLLHISIIGRSNV